MLEVTQSPLYQPHSMKVDGPWLYVLVERPRVWASDGSCTGCALDYDLARWRYAEDGADREWVILDDVTFDQGYFRGVFDGEVVWSAPDNGLWSCLADACAATKRQIGIGGTISVAKSVIADDQFLYWTSTDCIDGRECGPEWTVKRTPRIPR